MDGGIELSLASTLGLDRGYIEQIHSTSEKLNVSVLENKIVNFYTSVYALLTLMEKGNKNYKTLKKDISEKKVDRYKFFIALYEDNNNSFPIQTQKYLKSHPCGKVKLMALKYRLADSSNGNHLNHKV